MNAPQLLRLSLVIERGAEPIKGSLQPADGALNPFEGWIELACVLEALIVAAPPIDGDMPAGPGGR